MTMHPCPGCNASGMQGDYVCSDCGGERYFFSPYSAPPDNGDDDDDD